ncbi:MAG: hypothetical protein U1F67_15750 [Rubrivivax sp.]
MLDALLMAFPALGLAKTVRAVDVILAMDLPAFRSKRCRVPGPRQRQRKRKAPRPPWPLGTT